MWTPAYTPICGAGPLSSSEPHIGHSIGRMGLRAREREREREGEHMRVMFAFVFQIFGFNVFLTITEIIGNYDIIS